MRKIQISSSKRNEVIDITDDVQNLIEDSGIKSGICLVYNPHTTAGIFVNENYDFDVKTDIIKKLDNLSPDEPYYLHSEGNSDAHIKALIVGNSENFIIEENKIVLGTWQGIFFYEADGPRNRTIYVKIIEG